MHQPLTETAAAQILDAIRIDTMPVDTGEIRIVADAVRQINDPHGPSGYQYQRLQRVLQLHAPGLVARIVADGKEIQRLQALLAEKEAGGC